MIRGLDTIEQSLDVLLKRQENTSGNIANVNTTGYQAKQLFQSTLKEVQFVNHQGGSTVSEKQNIGGFTFGNAIDGSYIDRSKGTMNETGRNTDFAVNSDGYFTVRMNDGTLAYTRNGNFKLNDQNQYITQEGYQVVGANGQAVSANDNPDFRIVNVANEQQLTDAGNGYYTTNQNVQIDANPNVMQGYLEQSNVSMSDEMVTLMQTGREFEANQKVLSSTNETLDKAVNSLGKV
ncbi:flagellar hook-basal body complex protein [Liquorilactobacillus mali]|uniref:flagellar hook-basal body protein n=1 Tax=Liquorilactobacillus mali TaxID=1618 RepID=UPI000704E607|nr:flagellar hook-basal body complex protein [Liquorilactobacillus mali]MDN7145706.1 flagellar hook-basal body complex protein [Liquorilactobacillus mali]